MKLLFLFLYTFFLIPFSYSMKEQSSSSRVKLPNEIFKNSPQPGIISLKSSSTQDQKAIFENQSINNILLIFQEFNKSENETSSFVNIIQKQENAPYFYKKMNPHEKIEVNHHEKDIFLVGLVSHEVSPLFNQHNPIKLNNTHYIITVENGHHCITDR